MGKKQKSKSPPKTTGTAPDKKFKEKLQSIRDELNLNLVMADLRNMDMPLMGRIFHSLTSLKELCEGNERYLFAGAVSTMHGKVSTIIIDEAEYHTGMPVVLNLHKLLEEAFESFLYDGSIPKSFDKQFKTISGLPDKKEEMVRQDVALAQSDIDHHDRGSEEAKAKQETVIQELGDNKGSMVLDEFLTDSLDAVEKVEAELMELEKNQEDQERVNSIFRCFHSLKGAAGFMGLQVLAGLTHNAETALDKLRNGKLSATPDFINCMLTVLDTTERLLIQLKELNDPKIDDAKVSSVSITEAKNLLNYFNSDLPMRDKQTGAVEAKPPPAARPREAEEEAVAKKVVTDVVKVPSTKLNDLSELVGELVIALSILTQNKIITGIEDREVQDKINQMGKITESLRDKTFKIRMVPLESVFSRLTRQIRDLSSKLNKKVSLTTEGKDTLVDKLVTDEIYSPLVHIVRNALDHGLEDEDDRIRAGKPAEGNITVSAFHHGDSIWIEVRDDGKGLDRDKILKKAKDKGIIKDEAGMTDSQIFDVIFQPGFSTAERVTDVSGRGVGMDVVKTMLDSLRGKIVITSEPGKGSTFSLRLPMTTSIIEGLVVRIGNSNFIAPILSVCQTVTPKKSDLKSIHDREGECFLHQGKLIPILRLYEYFKVDPDFTDPSEALLIIVENGNSSFGLMADELLHKQQVVIKNIKDRFEGLDGISGGTILGNGQVGFILDPDEIVKEIKG